MSPCISVLMPAYNAARYIRGSVLSVLAQTFEDFELIVVNDGSTDATGEMLERISDPRLKIIHNQNNLRVALSLNKAAAQARGRYIARIDADDFCLPFRLEKQKAFLESHPEILLLGSEMFNLQGGRVIPDPRAGELDPLVIRWAFNVGNEIGGPTVMFRSSLLDALGCFMRHEFDRAEDYDFACRVLRLGDICTLREPLGIYRRHALSVSHARSSEVLALTVPILRDVHAELLEAYADRAGTLIAKYFMGGRPVRDPEKMRELGALLDRLLSAFFERHRPSADQQERMTAHAARLWWRVLQRSLQAGATTAVLRQYRSFTREAAGRPAATDIAAVAAYGLIPGKPVAAASKRLLKQLRPVRATRMSSNPAGSDATASGSRLTDPSDDPCSLYVVIDCAGDPRLGRNAERLQRLCWHYGTRPLYLLDPAGWQSGPWVQSVLERRACAVGVRLGLQIGAGLDRQPGDGAEYLADVFGIAPLFFGTTAQTIDSATLRELPHHGFAVGVELPMSAGLPTGVTGYSVQANSRWRTSSGIQVLSRNFTLCRDDLGAADCTRLRASVRSASRSGCRVFTLHCSAAALERDGEDITETVRQIDQTLRFFFDEFGALPGQPADLLPDERRQDVWRALPVGITAAAPETLAEAIE